MDNGEKEKFEKRVKAQEVFGHPLSRRRRVSERDQELGAFGILSCQLCRVTENQVLRSKSGKFNGSEQSIFSIALHT